MRPSTAPSASIRAQKLPNTGIRFATTQLLRTIYEKVVVSSASRTDAWRQFNNGRGAFNRGGLQRYSFKDKLESWGFTDLQDEVLDALFQLLDVDGDGEISYRDFTKSILLDPNFGRTRNLVGNCNFDHPGVQQGYKELYRNEEPKASVDEPFRFSADDTAEDASAAEDSNRFWDDFENEYEDTEQTLGEDQQYNQPQTSNSQPTRRSGWEQAALQAGPGRFRRNSGPFAAKQQSFLSASQQAQEKELASVYARETAGRRRKSTDLKRQKDQRSSSWQRTIIPGPFHGVYDPPQPQARPLSPMAQQSCFHEEQERAERARLGEEEDFKLQMRGRSAARQRKQHQQSSSNANAARWNQSKASAETFSQSQLQQLYARLYGANALSGEGEGHLRNRQFLDSLP